MCFRVFRVFVIRMSQKTYLTILKTGIGLSFISVFLVYGRLFFPYITSKQIYFNILIEVLFVFWLAFIIKYPEWRPKWSYISIGLISFLAVMLLSSFFSVDFNLSFWGDAERMLGAFHVIHFLIYYFIIITIMRTWQDWRNLLIISIIAAVLVSLYGQIRDIQYSTIGNTSYVSGYVIFNIYFALILFFCFKKDKQVWYKSLIVIAILILLSVLRLTHTRGAYVGLGLSVVLMLLLYIFLSSSKKIKILSAAAVTTFVIFLSLIFAYPNSAIVQSNSILNTVAQISLQASTFQTRLISWKAAWKDLPNHLILGTGHGNFAISFDKYFDPSFYNYTRSETYFDRAHNNIVDITSTTGILGVLTYLFIFAAVGYYLIKGYKKGMISANEFILLTCLIVAYFIQNLTVFDSLVTYISLMITLGFIYWLSQGQRELEYSEHKALDNKELLMLVGVGALSVLVIFQYNVKPFKTFKGTIDGQYAFAQNDIILAYEISKKTLGIDSVLDRDPRDIFVRTLASKSPLLERIEKAKAKEILDFAIIMVQKNIQYNPKDSLTQLELAKILDITSRFYLDNLEKFYFYSDQALEAVNQSINSSPGRIQIYFMKSQILLARGEIDQAIAALRQAISLNEKYYDSYCQLAKTFFALEREEEGYIEMDKCIDKGGAGLIGPASFVNKLVDHYNKAGDIVRVIKLYEAVSGGQDKNLNFWVALATLYEKVGDKEKAIEAARKAAEIDPSLESAVEEFFKQLGE